MQRARDTRDEFANTALLIFMFSVHQAFIDARPSADVEPIGYAAKFWVRRPRLRRYGRLSLAILKAFLVLFRDMLCAVSFPVFALLIHVTVQLFIYAFFAYVIYQMLVVW